MWGLNQFSDKSSVIDKDYEVQFIFNLKEKKYAIFIEIS